RSHLPMSDLPPFRGVLLPEQPTPDQLQAVVPDYTAMLLSVMTLLADRFERRADYPFIDTKLDLLTGRDFPEEDPVGGPGTVYGWIQGRGLEALAGHTLWLHRRGLGSELLPRLGHMMEEVLGCLRRMRQRNGGRLAFFMNPEGVPFRLDPRGRRQHYVLKPGTPYGFSDLFGAKGMLAAARVLGDAGAAAEARDYCEQVDAAIWQGRFASDQQPLNPRHPVEPRPGKHPHGPYMIQIGTASLMAELEADPGSVDMGLRLVRHVLRHHANLEGRIPELQEYDVWEAIDDHGRPYRDGKCILCDPGHALELAGLSLRFTGILRRGDLAPCSRLAELAVVERVMPPLARHVFALGFRPAQGGICKSVDLVSRRPQNTDMPWWSLPEAMRAAALCWRVSGDPEHLRILSACHNAFVRHYVRPDLHLMAVQTRNGRGEPVPVIPATADADPGYHTGLSLIDVLAAVGA
ncbi:MAG: AGE family epimerase/isomerase, partial [Candidatus Latescibacterota bacterium]